MKMYQSIIADVQLTYNVLCIAHTESSITHYNFNKKWNATLFTRRKR